MKTRLLRDYTIISTIAFIVVTGCVIYLHVRFAEQQLIDDAERGNLVIAQLIVNNISASIPGSTADGAMAVDDLDTEYLQNHIAEIDQAMQTLVQGSPVLKIKVYRGDLTIYSSERTQIGETKSGYGFNLARTSGQPISALSYRGEFHAFEGIVVDRDLVESYVPISAGATAIAQGSHGNNGAAETDQEPAVQDINPNGLMLEIYTDVTALIAQIQTAAIQLLLGLVAIFFVLYLVLLLVVRRADQTINDQHASLALEVAQRKQSEVDIRYSLAAAEEANRVKSDFLSSMSHELRTPMNSILGFGQLLADDPADPLSEKHQRYVVQILSNGEHLLLLINQVLDLAKIEAGRVPMTLENLAVSAVVRDCQDMSGSLLDQKEITLSIDPIPETLVCHADPLQLRQILLNLISNAVKYNSEGGTVHITTRSCDHHRIRISIKDEGPGISEDHQAHLFEPFNRLAFAGSAVSGTGVGLTIAKHLAEQMGGALGFESALGSGSTFWIDLQVGVKRVTAPVMQPVSGEVSRD